MSLQMKRRSFLTGLAGLSLMAPMESMGAFEGYFASRRKKNKLVSFFGFKQEAFQLTAIEKALSGFMSMVPGVSVFYECAREGVYHRMLRLRAKSGNLDDVFMVNSEDQASLMESDYLEDLSSHIDPTIFEDPLLHQFVKEDGKIYHVPMNIAFYGLFINTTLLEKHGIHIPWDFLEFSDACEAFRRKGVRPIIGNNYDFLHCLVYSKSFYPILKGTPFPTSDLRTFNAHPEEFTDVLMKGLEGLKEMKDKDWLEPEQVLRTNPFSEDVELFLKGETPFMFSNGGKANYIFARNPNFKFRIKPFPIFESGWILPIRGDTNIAVNSHSPHTEEVKLLLTFLLQPDVLREYCYSQTGFLPFKNPELPKDFFLKACREAINNKRIVSFRDFRMNHKVNQVLVEAAQDILTGSSQKSAYRRMEKKLTDGSVGPLFYV